MCGYISLRIFTKYIKEHVLLFIAVSCQIFTTVILSTMFDSSADNIKLDEFVFFFGAAVFRYRLFDILSNQSLVFIYDFQKDDHFSFHQEHFLRK